MPGEPHHDRLLLPPRGYETLEHDGRRLRYFAAGGAGGGTGAGPGVASVVLLHAFPLHAAMWAPQVDALAARGWRVLAPDLMGFGGSDAPGERSAYSVDGWADDVAAVMAHAGVEHAVVAGLSMGGYTAMAMVRRHRHLVRALVLCDTRPDPDDDDRRAARSRQQERLAAGGDAAVREVGEEVVSALVGAGASRRAESVAAVLALVDGARAEGWIGALEAMKHRPDSRPVLASFDGPCLVVVGALDTQSPPDVAEAMAAGIPGARLSVLPDAGHLSNVENTAAFDAALSGFLAGVAGAGRDAGGGEASGAPA